MITYHNLPDYDEDNYSGNFLANLDKEKRLVSDYNEKVHLALQGKFNEMYSLAVSIYGADSKEAKYLLRAGIPFGPDLVKQYNKRKKKYQDFLEVEQHKKNLEDYKNRRKTAEEILRSHGFIPGISYPGSKHISKLKELQQTGEIECQE